MRTLAAKYYTTFETAAGLCSIAWSDDGIAGFQLATSKPEVIEIWRKRRIPNAAHRAADSVVLNVIDGAVRYFSGEKIDFATTTVDLRGQPEFFVSIYATLRQVPYGETTTYGELAKSVGAGVERSREVGVAMATNPVPLIIPCHRVLAAGGRLSGFSAPGGTEAKASMLRLEGVTVESGRNSSILPAAQMRFAF